MGSFYTSVTLVGVSREAVVDALDGRRSFVAAAGSDVLVFDQACEEQDPQVLGSLCADLSRTLGCRALGVLNHDDDVLLVKLYRDGLLVVDYNSAPGYFDGDDLPPSGADAQALCAVFDASASVRDVDGILTSYDDYGDADDDGDDSYVFAMERHDALVQALGLPRQAVGNGYTYISEGAEPEGFGLELIEVGPDV